MVHWSFQLSFFIMVTEAVLEAALGILYILAISDVFVLQPVLLIVFLVIIAFIDLIFLVVFAVIPETRELFPVPVPADYSNTAYLNPYSVHFWNLFLFNAIGVTLASIFFATQNHERPIFPDVYSSDLQEWILYKLIFIWGLITVAFCLFSASNITRITKFGSQFDETKPNNDKSKKKPSTHAH